MNELDPARRGLLELIARADADGAALPGVAVQFADFVRTHADCCERTCIPGHLTGSAWVVTFMIVLNTR